MDPEACLRDADQHLWDGDWAEAQAALERYWAWRRAGGFEPESGDSRARRLERRLQRRKGKP
jgi:hypothetical protein